MIPSQWVRKHGARPRRIRFRFPKLFYCTKEVGSRSYSRMLGVAFTYLEAQNIRSKFEYGLGFNRHFNSQPWRLHTEALK